MPEPWRTGVFTRIEQETPNTRRFWIQIPELEEFVFKPGQFVTLDLPIHEQKNKRWRSYSIASPPDGNTIELVIVLLEGGAGTHYLFNHVQVGTEVLLRGPQGVFTLPSVIDRDLFFICTGTGIAPFRSMLHYIKKHQVPHHQIYCIFGTRTQKDILYYEEMKQLEREIPGLHYIPTLSREQWEGRTGYVHAVYEELAADKKPAHFYLCGWRAMINEARQRIAQMGYERQFIHFELFD